MAHGWDSYYHDIPPLSSDPGTLRRTSESEGSLSQHMDNFIGHHEFPGSGVSHEATSTNSNFNTNYYSNPNVGNANSDCAYQRYYKESQWQADGEQMEKDYLPRCENGDIDFTLDGLSTSESFSSSLPADLQGLKQDCGMLASSLLEDYSDVSSCSDADVRETRPSCQFMASNPPAKSKTDSMKHSSSEWLFTRTRNMTIPTESPCLSMSETNATLPSLSNEMTRENKTDCAADKIKSPKSTVDSYGGHSQCSTTTNVVTTTWSETEERNLDEAFKDGIQKEQVESDFTKKFSNISASDNFTIDKKEKHLDDNEKIDSPAPTIKATFQDDGEQDKSEIQATDRGETGSSENKIIDKQIPPNPTSTDGQGERQSEFTSTLKISSCEVESSLQLSKYQSHESVAQDSICPSPAVVTGGLVSDTRNKSKQNVASHPELCLEPCQSNTDLNCNGPADSVSFDTSNGKKQGITSHLESCLQQNGASTDLNTCPETVMSSAAENTDITSADPVLTSDSFSVDTNDKTTQGVACHEESSSTDMNICLVNDMTNVAENTKSTSTDPGCNGPNATSDNVSIDTSNKNKHGVTSDVESCSEHNSCTPDVNRCKESKTSLTDPVGFGPVLTSDSIEENACNSLEVCLQSNTSCTDINSCLEMEWTRPAEDTNPTSSPHQQPSLHQSPMDLEPQSVSEDVAENARESFEEMDTSTEEPSVLDMLYGEPLSREDSCDTDETKLNEMSFLRTDINTMKQSKLKSSIQMRKRLQPVVILQTESTNGISDSYHCANCQYTTQTVDNLIEHHHCCHSGANFQFCKTCNLYLTSDEEAQHLCGLTRNTSQLSSDSSMKKIKKKGRHKCIQCKLFFVKRYQYIKHMRLHTGTTPFRCDGCGLYFSQGCSMHRHKLIPGRCKRTKLQVTSSDAVTSETKTPPQTPPQKVLVENQPSTNLPKCFVKLVDMSNLNVCCVCGKSFSTAKKAKKHFYNIHKGRKLAILQCPSTRKRSVVESQTVEKEPKGQIVEKGPKGQVVEKEAGGKYKCTLCPKVFKYSYNRARHLRDCVKEKIFGGKEKVGGRYRCPLCYATFSLSSNRYRHINTCCLRVYLNRLAREAQSRARTEHKKTKETEQKSLSKETEQKSLSKESGQKKQSKESEQIKLPKQSEQIKQASPPLTAPKTVPRYKCQQCPAVFYHASGKYRHMKKHEIFKLTGKMFKYRLSVFSTMSKPAALNRTKTEEKKEDLTSTEANSSPTLSCHFCGKCFSSQQSLKKHERSHRGERPYRCLECGKGFKRRAYLLGHKIVHQRRIQCTVCRKILPTVKELIQHRSTHLKRGKLQCPDCHLQFQYPAHLLRHLNSHRKREEKATRLEEKPQLKPQQSLESVKEDSEPKQLQCSLCKEVFNDAQVLRKHCLTHIGGSLSHQCPFCKHNFNSRRYLLRHMIKHTGNKAFSCPHCGKQFYRDNYFKLHSEQCWPTQTREVAQEEPVTKPKGTHHCSYCPRVFSKKMRLKNHHRAHRAKTLLKCERCGQYYGMTKLNGHQKDCVGTKLNTGLSSSSGSFTQTIQKVPKIPLQSSDTKMLPLKCPHCTRRFRYKSLLLRHVVSHTGILPYACVHCGHRYRSRTMCLQHEAFCDGVFRKGSSKDRGDAAKQLSNMPTLREAGQKHQAGGESEYKCKFCTKTFMKPRNLRRHILTHNEVKPYRCKTCDSCYSRYDHLKVHQVRCKGKRSRLEICIPKISLDDVGKGWQSKFGTEPAEKQDTFECKICSRLFPTETKLSRHNTLFHTVKLYKCHVCGSSFSHEKTLKKHRKMRKCRKVLKETNASQPVEANPPTENVTQSPRVRNQFLQRIQPQFNKKYKYLCTYCPRAFGNSYQLSVHIRLHTGERPYGCEHCGMRFIRKDYLQRHTPKCTKKRKQTKVLCDRCGGFFLEMKLEDHRKSCTSSPSSSKSTVQQNQQSASQSPPKGFSCAYCNSRFLLFSQLQEHFLNAHKMETIASPASTAPLQHHLSNIPNIKEEPLDKSSDEQVSDDANVIRDLNTDLHKKVQKPFPCPQCKMSFVSKGGLMGHMRVHTMQPPFRCKTCKRGFWNKTTLRNHYRKCRFGRIKNKDKSHELEAPLKAEIDFTLTDSEVFKDSSKITSTEDLQTSLACKEEPMDESSENFEGSEVQSSPKKEKKAVKYQCSECDKSFTDGLLLISHLEDHGRQEQEKKRNTCTKCGRVCSSPGNLEKHMRSHGINKKYSCIDCSKTFDSYSDFESHKKCHDPNRPFACKLCNERFSSRPFLGNHYSEDHPDDVYTCQFCGKSYSVKKSMQRHIKKWHQKEQSLVSNVQEKRSAEQQPSSKLTAATEQQPSSKVSIVAEQQTSSKVSTTGESEEDENNSSEYSEDSDSAPYFPCHVCGKTFPTSESLEDHQLCHLGEKPHECAECGRCFFQASQLQQHQRMHKSEFQCQACGRGFVSLFALRKHKHTHGKSRPYRCSKCDLSFTGPLQLAEHMSTHREENFPCDICNRVFSSKGSRAEHWKSHSKATDHQPQSVSKEEHEKSASLSEGSSVSHKELKYRCGVCSERFRDPEKLSEHGCMAAKERPYSCSDCDKHFLHASHLKKHRATHEQSWSSIEYPCNQCNNSFSSSQQFLGHLKGHVDEAASIKREDTDEDPSHGFICPVCHQCFDSASELIDHFPMHPGSRYECEMCKMTFPSSSQLIEHERHHLTSATEFECTECGKSFLGKEAFCQHSCSHQQRAAKEHAYSNQSDKTSPTVEEEEVDVTGEDLHNCPACSKQFSSKSALLAHQNKQHQNEKPFKCDLCGKAFALRRYLREHERRHRQKSAAQTAETKFKCTQCYTEFSTAQELSLHMRLHAEKQVGEFRCDMCYKSFSQWSLLKQHQESHVGQIVYECDECDKAFAFPHLLEEHQQTHAGSSQ